VYKYWLTLTGIIASNSMASFSSSNLTLRLLIHSKRNKVLFAEASKPVVDFLFELLRLPLSTVIMILSKNQMIGSIANLYQSVENLDETYIEPDQHKDSFLKPNASILASQICALFPSIESSCYNSVTTQFYRCQYHPGTNITCDRRTSCKSCGQTMNTRLNLVGGKVASSFVKEVVTYMVTDDLVIQPMSNISTFTLFKKFDIKEIDDLNEKVVTLDANQVRMFIFISLLYLFCNSTT